MSTAAGRQAEQAMAAFLRGKGFAIIAQNWRTRWCEIDVVAQKSGIVYFVEVKYRGSSAQGSGLDYITPRKLQHMHLAAEFWLATYNFAGDYRLGAAELTGNPPHLTNWLDDI